MRLWLCKAEYKDRASNSSEALFLYVFEHKNNVIRPEIAKLVILVEAHAMTHGLDMNTFLLCPLNAFIAATSAMGM